jgi:SAM-dependent methyltransferase
VDTRGAFRPLDPGLHLSDIPHRLRTAFSLLELRALAARPFACPICGPSLLVRLAAQPIGVRCARCAGSAITLALVAVLKTVRPGFRGEAVYELSARGPLYEFLRREVPALTVSEYFDGAPPGTRVNGVLCQDLRRLTFADASFDVCTSTEVFEHVADDLAGFREVRRVLRKDGVMVFTVPLSAVPVTVERAVEKDGKIEHLLPAEYHGDRIRGQGRVLVFRDYGSDITERLRAQGFAKVMIDRRCETAFLGQGCGVIVAQA